MQRDEAIAQVEFMKSLIDSTRLRLAYGYPFFLLWGVAWVIGYLSDLVVPSGVGWIPVLIATVVGQFVLMARFSREATGQPPAALAKPLRDLNIVAGIGLLVFASLWIRSSAEAGAYFPLAIGTIYALNGAFFGRGAFVIGGWLFGVGLVALVLPFSAASLWLAIAGGGGLVATGLLLRRQLSSASSPATAVG